MASLLLDHELRIDALPYDVVVQILIHLDVPDLLSVSLVNRILHDVANSPILWRKRAITLLSQSRPLPMTTFPSICPSDLPLSKLRTSVLRSHHLISNWTSQSPLPVGSIKQSQINLSSPEAVVKMCRVGERWIVCSTECGSVVVWDLQGDGEEGSEGREVARYDLGHGWVVFNCRIDYQKGIVWCIAGQYPEAEDNMTITLLQIVFLPSFPADAISTHDITFTPLHTFMLPSSHVLDLFILDHHAQLLCVLFCIRETNHIGMYMLCGWGSGEDGRKSEGQWSVLVDMGISHDHQKVNTTALSRDKTHIILYTETYEYEERVAYEVRALWDLTHEGGELMTGNGNARSEGLEMQIKKAPEAVWRSRVDWVDSDGWQQRDGLEDNGEMVPNSQSQTGIEDQVGTPLVVDLHTHDLPIASTPLSSTPSPADILSPLPLLPTLPLLPSLLLPPEPSFQPPSTPSFTPNSSTSPGTAPLTPMSALHARRQSRSPLAPVPIPLSLSPLIDNTYGIGDGDLYGFEEVEEGIDGEREGLNVPTSFSFVPASAPALENHSFGEDLEPDLDSRSPSSRSMLLASTSTSPTIPYPMECKISDSDSTSYMHRDTPLDLSRTIPTSTLGRLSIPVPQTAPLYTGFGFMGIDANTDVDSLVHTQARLNTISRSQLSGHRQTDSMPTPTPIPTSSHLRMGRYSFSNRGRRIHARTHGRTQSETLISVVPEVESPCLAHFARSTARGSDLRGLESDESFSHTSGLSDFGAEVESLQSFRPRTPPVASSSSLAVQEPELEDAPASLTANSLLTLADLDASLDLVVTLGEDLNSVGDASTIEIEDVDPLQDLQNAQDTHLIPMSSYFLREWWPSWLPESDSKCTHTFKFDVNTLDTGCSCRRGCGGKRGDSRNKSSHIMIYNAPGTGIWRIVQSFEDSVDIYANSAGSSPLLSLTTTTDIPTHPLARTRFAQTIKHPVLVPNEIDMFIQPLLDVDYSHAVWVEWVGVRVRVKDQQRNGLSWDWNGYGNGVDWSDGDADWEYTAEDDTEVEEEGEEVPLEELGHQVDAVDGSMVKVERRLRILTFPACFDPPSLQSSPSSPSLANNQTSFHTNTTSTAKAPTNPYIRTLNIPQRILIHTTRLVLDQSAGAVLLCAPGGEMWEVRYS